MLRQLLLAVLIAFAAPIGATAQIWPGQDRAGEGRFIVVLNDNAGAPGTIAEEIRARVNGRLNFVYTRALNGFSITLSPAAAAIIERDPRVAFIEPDLPMSITDQAIPTGIQRSFAAANPNLMIDGADDFRVDVDIAVLDTGIDREHPDLNVVGGVDCTFFTGWFFNRTYYCEESADGDDDHYHGTHVAGSIGAIDNHEGVVGIAPGARLWAVKVLDSSGSGYTSGIIAGIDWVIARGNIEVINLSLSGPGVSSAFETAIDNAVANGVVVVVSAGNEGADASEYSPAFAPNAITVSALADFDGAPGGLGAPTCRTDIDDTLASFSNWGDVIDIVAPGVCILSTFPVEQGAYGTLNGTSMAAPHVAGAAGLLASGANAPQDAPGVQAIRDTLVSFGNFNWTDRSPDGVQEALLDVGAFNAALIPGDGGGPSPDPDPDPGPEPEPDPNTPPVANFSVDCDYLACSFTDASSDSDGAVASRSWNFGDGGTSSAQNPQHDYAIAGTYAVSLTVTDDDGDSDSVSRNVTVEEEPDPGEITLSVSGYSIGTRNYAELSWSGAQSSRVDVYRNGARLRSTSNDGSFRDNLRRRTGLFRYKICAQNANVCSNEAAISF